MIKMLTEFAKPLAMLIALVIDHFRKKQHEDEKREHQARHDEVDNDLDAALGKRGWLHTNKSDVRAGESSSSGSTTGSDVSSTTESGNDKA